MYEKQNNKPLLKLKKKNKRKHWIMTWKNLTWYLEEHTIQ